MVRYIGLDVLRGIAAFGIVGCHLCLSARTDGGNLVTALCVLMCVCACSVGGGS